MNEQLMALFEQIVADAVEWTPRLLAMMMLVVVGLVVAWASERILAAMLARLKFGRLLARSGIDHMLRRIGLRTPIDEVAPRVAFWLVLFLFARAAADVLELVAISDAIAAVIGYVPNLAAAIVILMIGAALAKFAGNAVRGLARDADVQFAAALGSATAGFIFFVLAMMAVAQLRIDTQMVQLAAGAILAGGALGLGLAFGFGSRDVMRALMAGFYARQLLTVGDELEVDGVRGRLLSVTPTQLLLETEDDYITVPNLALLERGGRQPKHGE